MKIIMPFKKEVVFKDNIQEITSISLEHQLSLEDCLIKGNFIITGEYRVSSNTNTVLPFSLDLPVGLSLEDRYDTVDATVDIDDFYYEIINDQKLSISIDICIDKLKEKELIDIKKMINEIDDRCIDVEEEKEEITEDKRKMEKEREVENAKIDKDVLSNVPKMVNKELENRKLNNNINSLFNNIEDDSDYISYNIYIVRDGDTVDSILSKYGVDLEILTSYNDISDLKIGDKIIIPNK